MGVDVDSQEKEGEQEDEDEEIDGDEEAKSDEEDQKTPPPPLSNIEQAKMQARRRASVAIQEVALAVARSTKSKNETIKSA